jgi:hypothetical protein
MPILPFIDLLILAGWSSLFGGFLLKLIRMTTTYEASFFGIGPLDFLILAGVFLLLALTLSARTWVKAHEMERAAARRKMNDELEQRIAIIDSGGLDPREVDEHERSQDQAREREEEERRPLQLDVDAQLG